jgi:predicted signal transduction protein with EAL and GGDEF domain
MLSHADVALYQAKAQQRGTYRFFTDTMDAAERVNDFDTAGVEV